MESLENQLLIAMPSLGDSYFSKTVTYICEHNDEGAMGLVINIPINITLNDLLSQLEQDESKDKSTEKSTPQQAQALENESAKEDSHPKYVNRENSILNQQVLTGGPISQQRGFVLHSPQDCWSSSLSLSDDIMITTSKDILLALGTDNAPEQFVVTLGYAGWGPGQLEQEISENSWLTTPADYEILFNTPIEHRWKKATEKLGINLVHLSNDVGHA
ncbi:MAG: YqgE/AlgH family protein [Alteromonadaceae bacterium]|nr:YqgE/AlgH family protein [Alteromonadaceae bacterium]